MGLFDSYFDAQPYSGGGGLIDRLLSQLGQQGQYQPPQQGAPNTMFAQPAPSQAPLTDTERQLMAMVQPSGASPPLASPVAQPTPVTQASPPRSPQASPIAIGDYMMPRIGPASAYASQPEVTDVSARAVTPDAASSPGTPAAFMSPPSTGGFGGFARGALANAHNGPLGMLFGGVGGAMGMGQGSPQDIQRQNMRAQYQALMQAGIPPEKALLATINPEYGKVIIGDALSNKQKFVQLKDGMGAEHPAFVDEKAQTINGQPIADYTKAQAQSSGAGGLGNMDLTGKAYLESLPKSEANIVQQMVEGTIAPPSSFALGKPIWAARLAAAKNYDPTFDATNWSGRVAGIKDFSAGKSSEMVRSANQTLHHVGQLLDSMDNLNNGDYPLKNRIGNALAEATGSGAQGAFRTNAHAVAEELSKVFKGSNLSDAEIRSWEQNLHENMSPEQQRTQVAKLRDLLQGSLQALEEKRLNSIGPIAAEKAGPLVKDEGQRVLDRISKWTSQGTGAAQGVAPAQTKTGVSWSIEK